MKGWKKVATVGLAVGVLLSATACSEEGAKKDNKSLKAQVEALTEQNKQLQLEKEGLTITEQKLDTSLRVIEGTKVPQFVTIDQKIKFPNKLFVPNATDDINASYIRVGSNFTFTPSNNWMIKMDGSTMNAQHPSKISGSIKAIGVEDPIPEADMPTILKQFFTNFPATNITYRKIFMDDYVGGMLAKAEVTVDQKPNVVNVGFLTYGDYGLLFMFDYEDDGTGVQQELVDLLIGSGMSGDTKIALE